MKFDRSFDDRVEARDAYARFYRAGKYRYGYDALEQSRAWFVSGYLEAKAKYDNAKAKSSKPKA